MYLGIDKCIENLQHLAVLDADSAYLSQLVVNGRKTRRLRIENDKFILEAYIFIAVDSLCRVVHKVCLHTVDDLHAELLRGKHRLLKALNISVVGDGDSLVTPVFGKLHNAIWIYGRVHHGHICMQVELHAFLGRIVSARNKLYLLHAYRRKHIFLRKFIVFVSAAHGERAPALERAEKLRLVVGKHHLHRDGSVIVSQKKRDRRALAAYLAEVYAEHLSRGDNGGHISLYLAHSRRHYIKSLAVNRLGRRDIEHYIADMQYPALVDIVYHRLV